MFWDTHHDFVVDPAAEKITGLTKKFCEANGTHSSTALDSFLDQVSVCDFIGGHNTKSYDDKMITSNLRRAEFDEKEFLEKPKIDSMSDIDYPDTILTRKLGYLAYEHGYILSGAHEALQDVFASAHLFSQYDFDTIVENAMQPIERRFLQLRFGDPKVQILKEHRFYWDPKNKHWFREIRANKVDDLHKSLSFTTDLWVQQQEIPNVF